MPIRRKGVAIMSIESKGGPNPHEPLEILRDGRNWGMRQTVVDGKLFEYGLLRLRLGVRDPCYNNQATQSQQQGDTEALSIMIMHEVHG